jgi:hypothetical protein
MCVCVCVCVCVRACVCVWGGVLQQHSSVLVCVKQVNKTHAENPLIDRLVELGSRYYTNGIFVYQLCHCRQLFPGHR